MASTKARKPKVPTKPPAPQARKTQPTLNRLRLPIAAGVVAVIAIAIALIAFGRSGSSGVRGSSSSGLPNTPDYNSLLVAPGSTNELILGTHQGMFRSTDGGRHWAGYALAGEDAMNLAHAAQGQTVWMAGHDVFAKSTEGGQNWEMLKPSTLPSLDLHGFAVDSAKSSTLYAAVAGFGLFRSTDAGASFSEVSKDVGGMVMALAVAPSGTIFASDMQRGLLLSSDGGTTWRQSLKAQVAGLAVNPNNPQSILATGAGIFRSTDGGTNWSQVKALDAGAGPVTWSSADPRVAYAVGFDRTLYRSSDGGATWAPVS